ncbi:MAG: large conductance mechanosensitive channel protein MscL [Gammaproteobacteria bacterium]
MSMVSEFKEFAMKGNVMDMAVGIIIGGAFGKIISSLVSDIIMPVVGKLMGGVDFSGLFMNLGEGTYATLEAAKEAGAATLNYGSFIQTAIDFLIIAFAIFMMIKMMNNAKKEEVEEAPAEPSAEEALLTEIRDLLKK